MAEHLPSQTIPERRSIKAIMVACTYGPRRVCTLARGPRVRPCQGRRPPEEALVGTPPVNHLPHPKTPNVQGPLGLCDIGVSDLLVHDPPLNTRTHVSGSAPIGCCGRGVATSFRRIQAFCLSVVCSSNFASAAREASPLVRRTNLQKEARMQVLEKLQALERSNRSSW